MYSTNMKKLLYLLPILFLSLSLRAQTIINSNGEQQSFSAVKGVMPDTALRGGAQYGYADTVARNAIPIGRRRVGMIVGTQNVAGSDGIKSKWELQTLSANNGANWKNVSLYFAGLLNQTIAIQSAGFKIGSSNGYISFDPTMINPILNIISTGGGSDPSLNFDNGNKVTGNLSFGLILDGIGHRIRTGGIDRLNVMPSGYVGIGNGAPTYPFSVTPFQYSTGTASQSGNTITGIGTTFTSDMIGSHIVFAQNGDGGLITGFTDATHLTAANSATYIAQAFVISYNAFNVNSIGHILLGVTPTIATGTNPSLVLVGGEIQQQVITGGGGGTTLSPTAVKIANYTAAVGDFVPFDNTSGNLVLTLPTAPIDGSQIATKIVIQGSTNTITINTGGSDVFNKTGGGTALTLKIVNQGILLQYKSSTGIWYVLSDDLPLGGLDLRYQIATIPLTYDIPSGPINSSNTSFTIPHTPIIGTYTIFRNGLLQIPGTDFNRTGTALTWLYAPTTGDTLYENYQY